MLLAIDVGNTQTVVGVFADGLVPDMAGRAEGSMPGLVHHWRVATDKERTADEWALQLVQLMELVGLTMPSLSPIRIDGSLESGVVRSIAMSSSVPSATAALRVVFDARVDIQTVIVEPGIKTGMPILYDNPKEVGADRIVNAVAAIDLYGPPAVVVDLGTATTFDAISAAGEYLGGAIVPGIEISMDALASRAAALRRVELVAPRHAIGRTTLEAMQSGAIFGYAALVDGLCAKFIEELGPANVIATGGLGGLVAPYATSIAHYEPWLTLHGLRLLFTRNCGAERVVPGAGEPTDSDSEDPAVSNDNDSQREPTPGSTVPYRFPNTVGAGVVAKDYEHLVPGEGSEVVVTIAGRIMRSRPQGKVAFAELRDWSGAVQLFALSQSSSDFDRFVRLSLGDWIGVTGEIVRTKRGEMSILVASWVLLADARLGFGDKWRGVSDVEVRFRQREVDLWANEGVRATFLRRSKIVASLRRTLDERQFVEVETPVLQPLAGGANARPFVTHYNALHADFYLRIAPELYLKRLVVGGFERVYEIGKDFRNEGLSPRHNPEFTMLEAYQAYSDYLDMAELIETLVANASRDLYGTTVITYGGKELDLTPPWRRATMAEVVEEHTGIAFDLSLGADELERRAASLGVDVAKGASAGQVMLAVYEKTTEPNLWGPVHVMDYPIEVSPLTRVHRDRPAFVERLTPVITGREIAEAYSELVDPDEQRRRLIAQASQRDAGDEEAMVVDEDFLRALEHGMPPTGGIGLGVDRLTSMILTDTTTIREVFFPPFAHNTMSGTVNLPTVTARR